ncbi:MAG: bifunctional YncE family protein/alkaline phosphatase family protein [Gemmatimonadaceae bacterium]
MFRHTITLAIAGLVLAACGKSQSSETRIGDDLKDAPRLPTGARLDPAGRSVELGSMPLNMVLAPEGDRLIVMLSGWREQGLQVVDLGSGRVTQEVPQPAAFIGMAFSPDGQWLYASGGNQDVVYRYRWANRVVTLTDSIILAAKAPNRSGTRYPAGLAVSADGNVLFVAENLADSLAMVDIATKRVVRRFPTPRYPYGVVASAAGDVYVSAWGGETVSRFATWGTDGRVIGQLKAGRHPSALLLNQDGSRLFVASGSTDRVTVVDTQSGEVTATLMDPPPAGPHEGSTPNALALSATGTRLFVAEADNNAVAVFDLSGATSGSSSASGRDTLSGRIPVGWYPTAVVAKGDSLFALNGKGRGTSANVDYPQPGRGVHTSRPRSYTLGQLSGSLTMTALARATTTELAPLSGRVERANGWRGVERGATYPPIKYVLYVIKENRTYDQIMGDMTQGDGDTSLNFFPRANAPNHHALADRFGLFDRFFVNAEVSPDGHNWSMAAYVGDYAEKTIPSNYSNRGRSYDYEGTNRGRVPAEDDADDVNEPASGYLWDLAQRAGITFRNYGEFVVPDNVRAGDRWPSGYKGVKPFLAANTSKEYPSYDLNIQDQRRADVFLAELPTFVKQGALPRLMIMRLPNDHTAGGRASAPTPGAYMADNDLALGRIVEALSQTPFWKELAIFVLEDDAQNGPDHVDSHRSPLLVISPYSNGGVHHRFTNTTDVIATIEEILGLTSLSQFDYYGRPLRDIWSSTPNVAPYRVLTPSVPLTQHNPETGLNARESERLALAFEDQADEDLFNRILWRSMKGEQVPYPGVTRMSALEWKRSR